MHLKLGAHFMKISKYSVSRIGFIRCMYFGANSNFSDFLNLLASK